MSQLFQHLIELSTKLSLTLSLFLVPALLLNGVYRLTDGVPIFQAIPAPTTDQLQALLTRIITRLLKMLTRKGALIEEQGLPYL